MKVKNNTRMNVPIVELKRVLRPNEVCDLPFEIAYKYRKYLYPLDATPAPIQKPKVPTLTTENYKDFAKNNLTKEVDILATSKKVTVSSLDDLVQLAASEGVTIVPKSIETPEIDEELEIELRDEKVKDVLKSVGLAEEITPIDESTIIEESTIEESEVDSQLGETAFDTFYGVDGYTPEQIEHVTAHKTRSNKRLASELNITEESIAEIKTLIK